MRTTIKCYLLLLGLFIQGTSLSAQSVTIGGNKISVHAGPAWYMGKFIGITDNSSSYRDGLRNGVAWSADYFYTGIGRSSCKFAPGVIYQGSQFKNSNDDGSDKILMHYIAPQAAFYCVKPKYTFSFGGGAGYQFYRDKSTVFDKPRNVSMNKFAFNLSAGGEYLFTSCVGISAKLNWITSASDNYTVKYHGKAWEVITPKDTDGGGVFSQLSLLIGLNFHL